jgi:general secretion pathway protein D
MSSHSRTAGWTLAALLLAGASSQVTAQTECPAHCKAAGCQAEQGQLVKVVYNVADLIVSPPTCHEDKPCEKVSEGQPTVSVGKIWRQHCQASCPQGQESTQARLSGSCSNCATRTQEEKLNRLICSTIEPASWEANGGRGSLQYWPLTLSFVVNQTPEIQERVAELLANLRRMKDMQVAVEVRFINLSEACFERFGVDFTSPDVKTESSAEPNSCPACANGCAGKKPEVIFLKDQQVRQFMEAAQGDRRTNIMQAPKVTMINGECAGLNITDQQNFVTGVEIVQKEGALALLPKCEAITTGLKMCLLPVISADHRFVQLHVQANQSSLDSAQVPLFPIMVPVEVLKASGEKGEPTTFTQYLQQPRVTVLAVDTALTIPDGGTALMTLGKRQREVRTEFGPPVLSKIPYINRLFKNVGYGRENETVMMMVTPRIIVTEEEETKEAACGQAKDSACPACCDKARTAAGCCQAAHGSAACSGDACPKCCPAPVQEKCVVVAPQVTVTTVPGQPTAGSMGQHGAASSRSVRAAPRCEPPTPAISLPRELATQEQVNGPVAVSVPIPRVEMVPGTTMIGYCTAEACPSSPPTTIQATMEEDQCQLTIQTGADSRLTCSELVLKTAGCGALRMAAGGKQIQLSSPCLRATADCLTSLPNDRIVLQGNVQISWEKGGQRAVVVGERVTIGLTDGRLEVEGAGKLSK